ncbi:SLAM family member 7-like isoform X2 [Gadus chalcogrammus]|uniref:SLAM family member 7-like isoform X2 n=1 Tax=Gadus chalcogrammus TaxID=1042646 RepID=UPI0024C39086|nr:SLAM family member 7-like isoform X2 [Gadus chalcogrammus]
MEMISALLLLLVMTSSADQEVKQNLTSTVGGEVTIPGPVKSSGYLVKERLVIASVRESGLQIYVKGFLDRVSWDRDTGRFTIRRLQSNDSGIYSVNQGDKSDSIKLSVYDAVLEPGVTVTSVSSEGCTLLCAVDQLSGGTLSWYQGEVLVNQSSTQRSLPLTVDRLALRSSYRCVSANPAGNLTRSVDANTSCTVQQRTGDEDEEESNRLLRILIPIFSVATVISVIVFVVKRRKRATDLQALILSAQDVTPKVGALWVPIYSLVHLTTVPNHSSIPKGLIDQKIPSNYISQIHKNTFSNCVLHNYIFTHFQIILYTQTSQYAFVDLAELPYRRGSVGKKEEAVQENTLYDLLQAPRIVDPTAAERT